MTPNDLLRQLSSHNDYLAIHHARYLFILNQILSLKLPKKSKVLDVGCYPPHLYHSLQKMGFDTYGIASYHEPVILPQVHIVNIEKEKLPFKSDFFDLILFTEVIEHLTENHLGFLKECHRLLKKDGRLFITTPNSASLQNRLKLLFGRSIYFPLDQMLQTSTDTETINHRHQREFTLSELIKLSQMADYKIDRARYFIAYHPFRPNLAQSFLIKTVKAIACIPMIIFPFFKDSLYLSLTK